MYHMLLFLCGDFSNCEARSNSPKLCSRRGREQGAVFSYGYLKFVPLLMFIEVSSSLKVHRIFFLPWFRLLAYFNLGFSLWSTAYMCFLSLFSVLITYTFKRLEIVISGFACMLPVYVA